MTSRLRLGLVIVVSIGMLAISPTSQAQNGSSTCDFDADGYSDLAIGSTSDPDGGAVNIIDGSPNGLTELGDQILRGDDYDNELWSPRSFGSELECGDFNQDGYDDLAVGAPGSGPNEGAVVVIYGSNRGLQEDELPHLFLSRRVPGVNGFARPGENFGNDLASGDFDGDGFDDLAIAIPGAWIDGQFSAGAAYVIYGSTQGLTTAVDQLWHANRKGVPGKASLDSLAQTLEAGDFNGDGYSDLVMGAPAGEIQGIQSGFAIVLYGTSTGLDGEASQRWHRGSPGVRGPHQVGTWAWNLAVGDFDGDGFDDLASADQMDKVSGNAAAGSVSVLYGGGPGLSASGDDWFHRDSPSVMGDTSEEARFGDALISADFDGNGRLDLAIGARGDSIEVEQGGSVTVLVGKSNGLSANGDQLWAQHTQGVPGADEAFDRFGDTLGSGDFNGDGYEDLAIGVLWEDVAGFSNAGRVVVLYGSVGKLTSQDAQSWSRLSQGIKGDQTCGFGVLLNYWHFNAGC